MIATFSTKAYNQSVGQIWAELAIKVKWLAIDRPIEGMEGIKTEEISVKTLVKSPENRINTGRLVWNMSNNT